MSFPVHRPRRLRRNENFRRMVRETQLRVDDLIMPLFIVPGAGVENPIRSMPGIAQLSVDRVLEECKQIQDLGIPGVILFGIPMKKTRSGLMPITLTALFNAPCGRSKKKCPDSR